MQENNTAKWYVIHTYSGYEAMVKSSLEKLIENNNLSDTILDIKIPMEQTIEEKNGKKKVVLRKLIPCYVFIKMIFNNDLWYVITNIKGVTGFVGPQGRLLPLTEDEVKRMGLETKVEIENINFAVGDNVKIVSGPLESFVGVINSLNFASQKANVKVDMFGRDTDVELDFVQIQRIDV
ncbi:MAG: transcription termination/antitermination factor NusG [Clostridia bacterium]|nr:transcription termination/antitermination factor NusG [Clostridia bacterium]